MVHLLLVHSLIFFKGHDKIIHVDFQPSLCDLFLEDVIHHCLEGCWGVCEAKEHDSWLKESLACFKGGFPLVSLFDVDIVIAPSYIELRE
jgi:hypothetical protein